MIRYIDYKVQRCRANHCCQTMSRIARVIRYLKEKDVGTVDGAEAEVRGTAHCRMWALYA